MDSCTYGISVLKLQLTILLMSDLNYFAIDRAFFVVGFKTITELPRFSLRGKR